MIHLDVCFEVPSRTDYILCSTATGKWIHKHILAFDWHLLFETQAKQWSGWEQRYQCRCITSCLGFVTMLSVMKRSVWPFYLSTSIRWNILASCVSAEQIRLALWVSWRIKLRLWLNEAKLVKCAHCRVHVGFMWTERLIELYKRRYRSTLRKLDVLDFSNSTMNWMEGCAWLKEFEEASASVWLSGMTRMFPTYRR